MVCDGEQGKERAGIVMDRGTKILLLILEGRSSDFDVLSMDVIWVPEFARAGISSDRIVMFDPHSGTRL